MSKKKHLTEEEKKQKQIAREQRRQLEKEKRQRYQQELKDAADKMIFFHDEMHCYSVYCPICEHRFDGSSYLKTVFIDERELWLANMVMHYRHSHITSWNKNWGYFGRYYRMASHFGNYDDEKAKVNERAKRQIARKCKDYIIANDVNEDVFNALQNTTEETLEVVRKIFVKKS